MSVCIETFRLCQSDSGWANSLQGRSVRRYPSGAFEEVENRQTRGKTGRTAGRQHVIGAGDIVTDRFRTKRSEKHRPRMPDLRKY